MNPVEEMEKLQKPKKKKKQMYNIPLVPNSVVRDRGGILTADFMMFVFLVFNAHLIILFAYRSLPDIPNAIISIEQ
jgi:hypothetical protein